MVKTKNANVGQCQNLEEGGTSRGKEKGKRVPSGARVSEARAPDRFISVKEAARGEVLKRHDDRNVNKLDAYGRLLHHIISNIIIPNVEHKSSITNMHSFVMLVLHEHRRTNFGYMAIEHMLATQSSSTKCMPYVCFITKILKHFVINLVGIGDHIGHGKIYNQQTFKRMGFEKNEEGTFIRGGQDGDDDNEEDDDEDQEGMNVEEGESEEEMEAKIQRRETRQKKRQERTEEGSSSKSMSHLMEMIASLQTSINTRFDAFDGRFEVLDGKVSNIQERLDALDHKITDTQERNERSTFEVSSLHSQQAKDLGDEGKMKEKRPSHSKIKSLKTLKTLSKLGCAKSPVRGPLPNNMLGSVTLYLDPVDRGRWRVRPKAVSTLGSLDPRYVLRAGFFDSMFWRFGSFTHPDWLDSYSLRDRRIGRQTRPRPRLRLAGAKARRRSFSRRFSRQRPHSSDHEAEAMPESSLRGQTNTASHEIIGNFMTKMTELLEATLANRRGEWAQSTSNDEAMERFLRFRAPEFHGEVEQEAKAELFLE
ncbi:hypothetical protein M9H77_26647 [Catharanthus roseus]|uniref:Uncharacterized protein n=1 Tax=Catharanthus roseus TaxID=4058 RepID=A0ACC0ACF3_CATRO|nr:hypothetical protein M9H77_26647 [Catharanthus roseus]